MSIRQERVGIEDLLGLTLTNVSVNDDNTEVVFVTDTGRRFVMFHMQDCCESVELEDVIGELSAITGSPVVLAEEVTNRELPPLASYADSYTWTFYNIATVPGGVVTLRWYGVSNGYYSEFVDFKEVWDDA